MKKKILALVSLILAVVCLLCSCGEEKKLGTLKLSDGSVSVEYLVEFNGEKIPFDLFRYFYLVKKSDMEEVDSKIDWSKEENQKLLLEETVDQLKFIYAVNNVAEKYDFSLTPSEKSEIESTMKEAFDTSGSAKDYLDLLNENFLTQDVYEYVLTTNIIYDAMADRLVGTDKELNKVVINEEDAMKNYNESHYRLMNIYFEVNQMDEEGNPVTEDVFESRRKQSEIDANNAYAKLKNKDFEEVMREYLSEEEAEANLQSYYSVESVSNLLGVDIKKLNVGETTEVIYAQSTYFIIKRLENDVEYLKKNNMQVVLDNYANVKFTELVEDVMNKIKVTESEHYKLVTPKTLV